jgi:radical SAM superfamily enzyme YgiQ (UPF0313 family)
LATRVSNILRGRKEIISLMSDANVKSVYVGVESLCGKNQKEIGKIRDIKELKELFEELLLFKIRPLPSYIFGFPNETKKDMEETYKNALYLGTKIFKFNIFTPYPGTELYQEMDANGLINHNISLSKYDGLHKVYHNNIDIEKIFVNYFNSYSKEIEKY